MKIKEYLENAEKPDPSDRSELTASLATPVIAPAVAMGGENLSRKHALRLGKKGKRKKGYKHLGKLYKQFVDSGGRLPTQAELPLGSITRPHFGYFPGHPNLPRYVFARGANDATKAHELGHGTGLGKSYKYREALDKARVFGDKVLDKTRFLAMLAPTAVVIGSKGQSNKRKAKNAEIARNIVALSALPQAPELFEEARATTRAVRFAPKGAKLRYLRQLIPSFGTYGFNLGGAALTGVTATELLRRHYLKKAKADILKRRKKGGAKKGA